MNEQQKVLNSPFDLETHKKTFVSYLEVIIDSEGNVMYAVPSHQWVMIRIATEKLNVTKERLFEMYASSGCDTIEWLSGITGYIPVWFDNYVGEPNEKQLEVLRKFREEGIYIGPTYNKYVKHDTVKEMLNVVYGSPHRNTDISESLPLSSLYFPPRTNQCITLIEDIPYSVMLCKDIEAMRQVSDDILNKLKETIEDDQTPHDVITIDSIPLDVREKAEYDAMMYGDVFIPVRKRSLSIEHTNVYLDTDMCYNIYEIFSESKKLSLKSVVEWSRECNRIDYTKDVKISFRFPVNNEYGHIAELTCDALNDILPNIPQHMLSKRTKENRDNFRKFIKRKSK